MKRHAHPWHRRFRHSLKWRLVALFFVLAAALAALFFSGSRQAFSAGWRELMRPLVSDYVDRLAAEVGSPPDAARARALVARLPLHLRIDGPALQFDNQPEAWRGHRERLDATADGLLVRRTADGHVLRFGVSLPSWEDRPRWVVGGTLAGLLLLVFAAFAYVRHLFRPLDDIRAGALRYGQGDFTQPIPVRRRDELGDLAAQVNTMAGELGRMLQGQRALLLAISHELRSPLTRARLNAELVPEGTERDALLRDLGAMRDLITDLLESERLAAGSSALQREPTDLDQLVRELVAREFADRAPALHLQLGDRPLVLDRTRMALLVRNLLDNAWRHSAGAAQPPELATGQDADGVWLTVRDHGPGVPDDQLAQLAEPFYRPDSARARHSGGVGLGLALCRAVARSHGGELLIRNAQPGLEVRVRLPGN